jgi:hypothetical protein
VEDVGQKTRIEGTQQFWISPPKPPRASQQTDEAGTRARAAIRPAPAALRQHTRKHTRRLSTKRIVEASLTRSLLPGARRRKQSLENSV